MKHCGELNGAFECNDGTDLRLARAKLETVLQKLITKTWDKSSLRIAFIAKSDDESEIVSAAFYAVEFLSLGEFEKMVFFETKRDKIMLSVLFALLTTDVLVSINLARRESNWYSTKLEILQEQSGNTFTGSTSTATDHPGYLGQIRDTRKFGENELTLVCTDGAVYDRSRDPPGQRSIYIAPGNAQRESYRLSTFVKYPQEVPVNPKHLASSGFFYTGFKDRVKCFSCGLCVEDWVFGDDVRSKRWHRSDCLFINGRNSGNIGTESDGLVRLCQAPRPVQNDATMRRDASDSSPTPVGHQTHSGGSALKQTARYVTTPSTSASSSANCAMIEFATIPSAFHENFLKNLDLRKESERLRSFEHWPSDAPTVSPNALAQSGFFYLGNLDRVQCFSCAGVLRNWNYGDLVNSEHRRHFPHCRLVQGAESRNIPLTPEERAAAPQQQPVFFEPPDPSERERRDLECMFQCRHPVNPHMRNVQARFETFDRRWASNNVNATTMQIARAGFFYLGERDRVKCWYCNGGLQNFDPQDEPWTEHAKWFPTCEFLLQKKGPDFVHRMVAMFPNLPRPILRGGGFDVPPQQHGRRSGAERSDSPVEIIDPQENMRQEEERLDKEMQTEVAKAAVEMGFERRIIRRLVKRRLQENNMYVRVADIIDDVLSDESGSASDEEDEEMMTSTSGEAGAVESLVESMSVENTPSMQERINQLQSERLCRVCKSNASDLVLVPCGHLCCCASCNPTRCPTCGKRVESSIRAYII